MLDMTIGELVQIATAPAPAFPSLDIWQAHEIIAFLGTFVGETSCDVVDLWATPGNPPTFFTSAAGDMRTDSHMVECRKCGTATVFLGIPRAWATKDSRALAMRECEDRGMRLLKLLASDSDLMDAVVLARNRAAAVGEIDQKYEQQLSRQQQGGPAPIAPSMDF